MSIKKIIAREGLIILPASILLVIWTIGYYASNDKLDWWYLKVCIGIFLIFYLPLRFIVWAIKTLKEK